jgi:hypothetical protein
MPHSHFLGRRIECTSHKIDRPRPIERRLVGRNRGSAFARAGFPIKPACAMNRTRDYPRRSMCGNFDRLGDVWRSPGTGQGMWRTEPTVCARERCRPASALLPDAGDTFIVPLALCQKVTQKALPFSDRQEVLLWFRTAISRVFRLDLSRRMAAARQRVQRRAKQYQLAVRRQQ